MATYVIVAVRKSNVYAPRHHEHIESVKSDQGTVLARSQVIAKIRANTDTFVTAGPPGLVYVHNCPHCGTGDYITTHPDATPTNNLLQLPTF